MSATGDIIRGFIENSAKLPPASLPAQELDEKKIDPSEYLKSKPVSEALNSLVGFLNRFATPEAEPFLDKLPPALVLKIQSSLSSARQSIDQTLRAARKASGQEQVGRSPEDSFKSWGQTISTVEGDLFAILAPIETEMKLGAANSDEMIRLLAERQQQLETLESSLTKLLQQAENTKHEVENAEQKATGTKQAIQATVLTKGFIDELRGAIYWHRVEGAVWLAAFGISCLVTLRFLVWIAVANNKLGWPFCDCGPVYNVLTAPVDIGSAIAMGIGKLLFASFAFGMCFLTARIYQTHAHNVIVNQQRRIAGISFPQLLEMIDLSDKESRQELVRQAAISVFAHGSSGFLHKGGNEFAALASVVSETFNKSKD